MTRFIQSLAVYFSAIALVAALVSCGGSKENSIEGTGMVGILLTDMPADPALRSLSCNLRASAQKLPVDRRVSTDAR